MKRSIVFIFCVAVCNLIVTAQRVMPKFGISKSTVEFSDLLKDGAVIQEKLGVVVGVAVELPISKRIAFQPEILFHQKGWVKKIEKNDRTETYSLNYFELPLMLKLKLSVFHFNAGPFVSYGYDGTYKYKETVLGKANNENGGIRFGKTPKEVTSGDIYLDNNFDYGIQAGFGFTLIKKMTFDIRYSLSYNDIYANHPGDHTSRNKGFQLTIGFPSLGKDREQEQE
jgi:hypothetical protein